MNTHASSFYLVHIFCDYAIYFSWGKSYSHATIPKKAETLKRLSIGSYFANIHIYKGASEDYDECNGTKK